MWKKLSWLAAILLAVVSPGVGDPFDDPNDPPPNDPDPNDPDPNEPDPNDPDPNDPDPNDPDPNEPDPNDPPQPRESRAQRTIRETRERAQRAEEVARDSQRQLEELRRQLTPNKQQTEEQRLWEQEEAVLRDPNAEPWQRYAVTGQREARLARSDAQKAMRNAEDMSDKASFDRLSVTKPKLYDAYATRVEDELKRIRSNGSNAPREGVLAVLIGQDMLAGKLKTGQASSTPRKGGAARQTPPNARSDVSGASTGRLSDAEKRAKRLENVRI